MSPPAVKTSSATGGDVDGAEPSHQQTAERTQRWEEPHPGVPIPLEAGTVMQASSRIPSEAWRGDMAARGYGYFRTRSGVARRYSRPSMRVRTTKPPRIIQQNSSEETVTKTGHTARKVLHSESTQFELTPSPDESTICPTPVTLTVDGDTNEDVDMSLLETPVPSCDQRSLSLDMTDFSDHINKALDGVHSNSSSLTVCELGSYTQATPEVDLYGWEAELKQKLESGCNSSLVCTCLQPDRRRHTGHKRNLLQRVFSLGEGWPRVE
jgi:hypothetical protein